MSDFNKDQGDIQGVGANTRSPKTSGTPATGFSDPGGTEHADFGPGPGVPANTSKIR